MDQYADSHILTESMLVALCNRRRRIFVRYMADHGLVELKDVAEAIAAIEETSRKSAYNSLYQTHTSKLFAANIIKEANGGKTYERGANFDMAAAILQCCEDC